VNYVVTAKSYFGADFPPALASESSAKRWILTFLQ